jgi:hypothetical protein
MDAIATRIRVSVLCLVHKDLHIPLQHDTSMNKLDLLQGLKCIGFYHVTCSVCILRWLSLLVLVAF